MAFSHRLVREILQHYAYQADFAGPFHLTLSRERYLRVARRRGYDLSLAKDDFGGCLVGRPPVIWINALRHKSVRELADTCAHEMWHAASSETGHRGRFYQSVRSLTAGRDP